jgi:polygalacturonase
LNGGGKIDGRGYVWWLNSWLVTKKYMPDGARRPHLIVTQFVYNLTIHDLLLKNSPCFHIRTESTINAKIYNIDIKVNTTAQLDILKRNFLTGIIPLFPLNTDGIDPSGSNFHIFNISCQNYDDVIVPKPTHRSSDGYTNCTENMLIENITVRLGVGLSIGSVPPNNDCNCVRNITFRNAHFEKPFKGIYVKTNPGNSGDGIIDNILY